MASNRLTRRKFLQLLGAGTALLGSARLVSAADWEVESAAAGVVRQNLEDLFAGRSMALDFRCIDDHYNEAFRIQINAFDLYPVASCFKALLALYYFMYTPQADWDAGEFSPVYRTVVFSNNVDTGVVLENVSQTSGGRKNAVEKFNDFLRVVVGLRGGLYSWNWEGSPTTGLTDVRYAPSTRPALFVKGQGYSVDNAFSAADLSRGYDFIIRGEFFSHSDTFSEATRATQDLLSIAAGNYRSPIERVFPDGYMGKDGILPSEDIALGRVVNDSGVLLVGENRYVVTFMSAGESESTAIYVLGEVIAQINVYENAIRGQVSR